MRYSISLGVHVSIAGKIYESLDRARALGCNTMQIFSRSPRSWKTKTADENDIRIFVKKRERCNIWSVAVHAPYIINLASPDNNLYRKSLNAFFEDLCFSEKLGADFFVTHLGSHRGRGKIFGLNRLADGLNRVLSKRKFCFSILLETTAGSGYAIGDRFEDLWYIIKHIRNKSVGICFDTAHVFAAGYDISTGKAVEETIQEFDKHIGIERLKLLHLNDSQSPLGSHVDRHEHIGMGRIGLKGFRGIVNHPAFAKLPMILETPKRNENDDAMNISRIRRIYR